MANYEGMSNTQVAVRVKDAIFEAKPRFLEMTGGDIAPFLRENEFAMQILHGAPYLADVAGRNPTSLRNALVQSAVTGISLNPVHKHAYLVPRDGAVVFDPSYRGLRDTAIADGIVRWVRADVVRENDEIEQCEDSKGNRWIEHRYNAFATDKARGAIIGGYCQWEDGEGHRDYVTENIEELYSSHRARSDAWTRDNKQRGIWKTDEPEAIRKSMIKRAQKSWPRRPGSDVGRFDAALAAAIAADDTIETTGTPVERIDEREVAALTDLLRPHVEGWCQFYKIGHLGEMTVDQRADLQKRLDARAKAKKLAGEKAERRAEPIADETKPASAETKPAADETKPSPSDTGTKADLDTLWREIDDGLVHLAGGDLGRTDAIAANIRKAAGLPKGDLTPAQVEKFHAAVAGQVNG